MKNKRTKVFCLVLLVLICISMSACQASKQLENDAEPETEQNNVHTEQTLDEIYEDEDETSDEYVEPGQDEQGGYDGSMDTNSDAQDEQATDEVVE